MHFFFCLGLRSIQLNNGLRAIEYGAFDDCRSLTSLTIPKTVERINFTNPISQNATSLEAIHVASGNKKYFSVDGVIFDKTKKILCEYPAGKKDVSYKVPDTVEIIYSMRYSMYLQEITLPSSVRVISDQAFFRCEYLTKVNMTKSVERICSQAFYECRSLKEITIPKNVKSIADYAFFGCTSLQKIRVKSPKCIFYPSNSVMPGNTVLYGYAGSTAQHYAETYGRTFVNIETNQEIKYVYDADRLLRLLPSPGEVSYGEPAYAGITIEDDYGNFWCYQADIIHEYNTSRAEYQNLKRFTDDLVKGCTTNRQKIETISNWVHENMEYSFGSISGNRIESVYGLFERLYGNCMCFTQLTNYMLYLEGIPTASVIVPGHEMGAAFDGQQWCVVDSTNAYIGTTIPDDYGRIEHIVFSSGRFTFDIRNTEGVYLGAVGYDDKDQKTIKSVTIPTFIKGIYEGVFSDLPRTTVIKGTTGTVAEEYCKRHYKNIKYSGNKFSVVNKYIKEIKDNSSDAKEAGLKKGSVFSKNGMKYKVTQKATSKKKGTVSCIGCTGSLSGNVKIPGEVKKSGKQFKVTEISAKAFQNNKKIKKVTVPKEVNKIGRYAFAGCTKLKDFVLGASVKKIGAYAFKGDGKLKTLKIQTGKLTKANVKNSLQGSYVKTLKLSHSGLGKKSYYKKIFKKSNSGRKVKIG